MNWKLNWRIIRASLIDTRGARWIPVNCKSLTALEKEQVVSAEVVASQYGISLMTHLKDGKISYIPMCATSKLKLGDKLDVDDIRIVTLYLNSDYIYRAVEKQNVPRCVNRKLAAFKKVLWYKVLKPIRNLHWRIKGRRINMFDDLILY